MKKLKPNESEILKTCLLFNKDNDYDVNGKWQKELITLKRTGTTKNDYYYLTIGYPEQGVGNFGIGKAFVTFTKANKAYNDEIKKYL